MDREEALKKIFSESSHERFLAVLAFEKNAISADMDVLLKARARESDAFVLSGLERAIQYCSNLGKKQESNNFDNIETEDIIQARAHATEWIAGMLLHEVGSKLGLVAHAASKEVPNYENSKTKRHIRNFQGIFAAIEQLRSATSLPKFEQFDLSELIEEVFQLELDAKEIQVTFVGIRPLLISSDRNLLRLALCNGVRNAIEAVIQNDVFMGNIDHPIIVSWGVSDVESWISIIDSGTGLSGHATSFFEIGKSSKKGHPGFGLPIARQAMETLNGSVRLMPSISGGATYEIRWKIRR